jgi:hypothetical protein
MDMIEADRGAGVHDQAAIRGGTALRVYSLPQSGHRSDQTGGQP